MDQLIFRAPPAPPPLPKPLDPPPPKSVDDHAREAVSRVIVNYERFQGVVIEPDASALLLLVLVLIWLMGTVWAIFYVSPHASGVSLGLLIVVKSFLCLGACLVAVMVPVLYNIQATLKKSGCYKGAQWDGPLEPYITALWSNPGEQHYVDSIRQLQQGHWWTFTGPTFDLKALCAQVTPVLAALEKDEPEFATYTFDQKVEVVGKRVFFLALREQK
jgi:hypothetical protein